MARLDGDYWASDAADPTPGLFACKGPQLAIPPSGIGDDMASDVEIGRSPAAIAATLNDQNLDAWDTDRVQEIVTELLGGEQLLTVDDGGGFHETSGARVGSIRRTPSGEWITERQNEQAARSDTAIPAAPPQGKLRSLMTKLKVRSS